MKSELSIAYLEWLPHIKKLDTPRYMAILSSPRVFQSRLAALTQFHFSLAEIAESSSDPMICAIRLAWWREACDALKNGVISKPHPVLLALASDAARGIIDVNLLCEMIASKEYEMDSSLLKDTADFLLYIDGSIGALHLAWAQLLKAHPLSDSEKEAIILMSRAVAITRLLLAIPKLAHKHMLRFSVSDMAESGLLHSSESLMPESENLHVFCSAMSDKAGAYLMAVKPSVRTLPVPLRVLYKFAIADRATLIKARYNPYDAICHRPHPLRDVLIAMRA